MTQIRIDTDQVRETGRRFNTEADLLAQIGRELQSAIGSLDTGAWDGRSRARAAPLLNRVRPESEQAAEWLDELGRKLAHVADIFEQEDNTAAGNVAEMPWVNFEVGGGAVLGAATVAGMAAPTIVLASLPLTGDAAPNFANTTWAERFAYAEEFPGKIEAIEGEMQQLQDLIAQDNVDIVDIERQIRDLKAERDRLQTEADNFWNKVKRDPDGWKWGFDDGVIDAPWRTQSDAMEDQIGQLDKQIQDLENKKAEIVSQRDTHQQQLDSSEQHLAALQQSQTDLNKIIQQGIPSDGPTKETWLMSGSGAMGGCTRYVAEKRDVAAFDGGHPGNASEWSRQARNAKYEVGSHPVKGAIVAWESNHVAYVEWVDPNDPTHFRISEANTIYLDDGSFVRGKYTPPTTRDVHLGDETGISFIYGKSSTTV